MTESWLQIAALFLAIIVWFRSESRSDWRLMDSKMESFRAEMGMILREMKEEQKRISWKTMRYRRKK